eukprot:519424-Ditylum_brightwellii.AAC.1
MRDLIKKVAPMMTNESKVKFIPMGLKYDQTIQNHSTLYINLLREQNVYLPNYADFQIGGLTEETIDFIISVKTLKENTLATPYVMDINHTAFTDEKGIWTVETTKENVHKAMQDVDNDLEVLQPVFPDLHFTKIWCSQFQG